MKLRSRTSKTERATDRLKRVLGLVLKKLRVRHATAYVLLVKSADLKKLKAKYYKKKKSHEPDVLSFRASAGFPRPDVKGKFLGEIYLNENLVSDPSRLKFLLVHGLLHLLGYSHDKKHDTLRMQSLEKTLVKGISKQ
jgi:rRNA maturation RNase YbeY